MDLDRVGVQRWAAFTRDGGGGNPAGVVLDARAVDDATRLQVAAAVGCSETVFVEPTDDPAAVRVAFWSPRARVPFCGHASVATAVALTAREDVDERDLVLRTDVGDVPVAVRTGDDGSRTATLTSVPTRSAPAAADDVEAALVALRWRRDDLDPDLPPHVAHAGNDHLVLAVSTRRRLAQLDYAYDALEALMADRGWTTLQLVHVEPRPRDDAVPWRVHARDPFPPGGVVEDPATGAAALALGGWLRALGRVRRPLRVEVLQGEDMGAPSRLLVDVDPDDPRVRVTGAASLLDP